MYILILKRKKLFEQFMQHRCNIINQDVSTRGQRPSKNFFVRMYICTYVLTYIYHSIDMYILFEQKKFFEQLMQHRRRPPHSVKNLLNTVEQ